MLKVEKTIRNPKNKSQDDNLTKLQNNSKNSIKNLYISNQKKTFMQNFSQKLEMNMQSCKKKVMNEKLSCTNIEIIFKTYLKNHIRNHHTKNQ